MLVLQSLVADKKVRMSSFWIEGDLVDPFLAACKRAKRPGDDRDTGKTTVIVAALREYLKTQRTARELSAEESNWIGALQSLKPGVRKIALRVATALRRESGTSPDMDSAPSTGSRSMRGRARSGR